MTATSGQTFLQKISLSRNCFLILSLFSAHRSSSEATGRSRGISGRTAPGKGFHLSCSLHTWTFPFCQQFGHPVRPVIFKLFVTVWAGLVSLQSIIFQICHEQEQTSEQVVGLLREVAWPQKYPLGHSGSSCHLDISLHWISGFLLFNNLLIL